MKLYIYNFKSLVFISLIVFTSSMAYAVVRVNVALPIGYYVSKNIGTEKYLNADKVTAYPNKFYCLDNRVCNADKKTIYEGITLTVEHHFAGTAMIGGAAWFDIRNSYTGKYVTSCEVLGYSDIALFQVFCYVPVSGELRYPWSITQTTTDSYNSSSNPHFQIFFAPVLFANEEHTTGFLSGDGSKPVNPFDPINSKYLGLLNSYGFELNSSTFFSSGRYPGVVQNIPTDYDGELIIRWWNDAPLIKSIN